MEIIHESSMRRQWPCKFSETCRHRRSKEMKDNLCQTGGTELMEPLVAANLQTGLFRGTSSHARLVHHALIHEHFSPSDTEKWSTDSDASSCYEGTPKLSKKGWIFSTAEVLNGQNGCYLSGSCTCSSGITDDHLLHRSSSVLSICNDELIQSNPNLTGSPDTSSLAAVSDGSPSIEGIGSTECSHPDQLTDDFMLELGPLGDLFPDVADLDFAYAATPQYAALATNSRNSSGASNEEGVALCRKDDMSSANVNKEYGVASRTWIDPMEHAHSLQSASLWENQKRYDGLEEIFTPATKRAREESKGLISVIPSSAGGSCTNLHDMSYSVGPASENGWQSFPSVKECSVAAGMGEFPLNPSKKRVKYEREMQSDMLDESASKFIDQTSVKAIQNNKLEDNIASQTPGPISVINNEIQPQPDNTKEFVLNPVLGSLPVTGRSEGNYSEICLVHLLIAGAEAVATRDMDLASVILVRLKELVSFSGSAMHRVAAYFSDGLQSRIEGNHALDRVGPNNKSRSDLLAAFQILHEISPYIKFGHFTANQALLEAVEGEKSIHIVDFEVMEGIQWPPFMQALVSRKGGPPHLKITALCRPHAERGLAAVQETGRRLDSFAASLDLPFLFNIVLVNKNEEFSVSSIKLVKGEALAVNCMVHLPHMPHRTAKSVASFLHGMRRLSPTVLTLVEEELGCSAVAVVSYFFEALHHYTAICDSLEACLSSETVARMLVEQVFLAPRVNRTVMFWSESSAQMDLGTEFATYNWCSLVRSIGFKSLPLSFQNLSQARLLLGLYKDGFKLDERSNRLLLGWRSKPLFAASVWN